MWKYLVSVALACVSVITAFAADLPVRREYTPPLPAYVDWSGWYVSGYTGVSQGLQHGTFSDTTAAAGTVSGEFGSAPSGIGLGGAVGYNWQLPGWVIGLRVDGTWDNAQGLGQIAVDHINASSSSKWNGDFNVLAGIPLGPDGRVLAYVTGGPAWATMDQQIQVANAGAVGSTVNWGWDVGIGTSYAINDHWRIFAEEDYYSLGSNTVSGVDTISAVVGRTAVTASIPFSYNQRNDFLLHKLGFSYKF